MAFDFQRAGMAPGQSFLDKTGQPFTKSRRHQQINSNEGCPVLSGLFQGAHSKLILWWLRKLRSRQTEDGFTLIELLVVIIIIGILSAIALPSFLNQANKAKQAEAKLYVGSINKGQQAYYLEHGHFADSVADLGVGIKEKTTNYEYKITINKPNTTESVAIAYTESNEKGSGLKNYAGFVSLVPSGANGELTTVGILCEQKKAGDDTSTDGSGTKCGKDQIEVGAR